MKKEIYREIIQITLKFVHGFFHYQHPHQLQFSNLFHIKRSKTLGMFRKGKSPVTMAKFSKIISGLLPLGIHRRSQNAVAFHASRTELNRKSWCCCFLCSCCWCKVHQLVSISKAFSPSHNIL